MRPLKLNQKIELQSSKYTIQTDSVKLEEQFFQDVLKDSRRIKESNDKGKKLHKQFHELHVDLFNSFYKYLVDLLDEKYIHPDYVINRQIMEIIIELDEHKKSRGYSRADIMMSVICTESMQEEVLKLLEELLKRDEELKEKLKELQEALEQAEADGKGDGDQVSDTLQMTVEEAQKKLEEYKKTRKALVSKEEKKQLEKSLETAVNNAQETSDMIQNWGLGQSATFSKTGYQEKMKLLDKLRGSKKLKEIAALVGKYRHLAMKAQSEKVKKGMDEVYDIVLGDNLERVVQSEYSLLAAEETEIEFLRKYSEKSLSVYKYESKEKKHKGPIVICLDESGSMSGQPEMWAKAVALGLLEIAKAQKRSFYVIHFSDNREADLHTNAFMKGGETDIEEIMDMVEYFDNGGTNFEPPLNAARKLIDKEEQFTKADIIFVTDGEAAVSEAWLKKYLAWKKERKISVYSILIDVYANSGGTVKKFSDRIEKLSFMRNGVADQLAESIFTNI